MRFAVIGDPVAHSVSPALHAAVYERLGINARYEKIYVPREELGQFAGMMKYGKTRDSGDGAEVFRGLNVTIPHKAAIIPLLDEIRGDALAAGAVNTVVFESGAQTVPGAHSVYDDTQRFPDRLIGYNTDMEGLLRALRGAGAEYKNSVVCIFGTGGAALGAAAKAAAEGAKTVRVIGRNKEKADAVCARAGGTQGTAPICSATACLAVCTGNGSIPAEAVLDADIFINATPLGMQGAPQDFEDTAFLDALPKTSIVYDCVYIPAETKLVREARARGLRAENGLAMLVWQGLLSDVHFLRAAGAPRFDPDEILAPEMFHHIYKTLETALARERFGVR